LRLGAEHIIICVGYAMLELVFDSSIASLSILDV
jgi:hypothetical protein